MSYIVCRNCKKFIEVDESRPLNFDKCENCGHTLEFACNNTELQMMLNDVLIPQISYNKVCASCHSVNPKETASCLHCGSTNLQLQYDLESIQQYQNDKQNMGIDAINMGNTRTIIIKSGENFSPKNSIIVRIFSLIIGLVDFFFFSLIGIQYILGSSELPSDVMAFATQNMYSLTLVISVALVLSGLMSVMIIPRMSYRDSVETASTLGIVVGLITLIAAKDLLTVIVAIVLCTILTSIGGLIGEFIIHKLTRRL